MLIINQTPDSFSGDGKLYNDIDSTLAFVEKALNNNITLIDIGADSTRPDAELISIHEEINRLSVLIPAICQLKKRYKFKISLDSYKPEVIKQFIDYIDIINDVSGNIPTDFLKEIINTEKQYVAMHSLTVPADPKIYISTQADPTHTVYSWAKNKIASLKQIGLHNEQIIIDVGIGFNKTYAQNLKLLRSIHAFQDLDTSLLVGCSRKRFIKKISQTEADNRDIESHTIHNFLCGNQVDYIRIHEFETLNRISNIHSQLKTGLLW